MSDITTYASKPITELMANLELHKRNPGGIARVFLEHLDEVTAGRVKIVDPTSPFVFMLEAAAVIGATAVNETIVSLRKQYSSLSQTEEDLYLHMSDKDYLNRFAVPASGTFTVAIQVNDLMNKMVYDSLEDCHKAVIPRDSEFIADQYIFTLQYPIVLRKYSNGVVDITYDGTITSPFEALETNDIKYGGRRDSNNVDWIFFDIKLKQFNITSTEFPLQKSIMFSENIETTDKFYYIRTYYRNNATDNKWVEMKTTHTDQVFDASNPTSLIKVYDKYVNVSIPPIYLNSEKVSGAVRFDVYTTKGAVSIDFSNYKLSMFTFNLRAIDDARDLNQYTEALSNLSRYAYSKDSVTGGRNSLTYDELRARVINNNLGERKIPINSVHLEGEVNDSGFDLVRNVDTLTNRMLLATKKLPKPENSKLTTSANIGISSYVVDLSYLNTLTRIRDNGLRTTVMSKNLFRHNNGVVAILDTPDVEAIKNSGKTAMVNHLNAHQYVFNPFYYVLDNANREFEVRAYDLDYPTAERLNFLSQNQTLQLPVNVDQYTIEIITNGYRLTIITKSGNFYKQLDDAAVGMQLAYYPSDEKILAYINGSQINKLDNGERVFQFDMLTNYDLTSKDQICLTNAKMFGADRLNTWFDLSSKIYLFHYTTSITSAFTPDDANVLLGKFILPAQAACTSMESIDLKLGDPLKNLWSRCRTIPTGIRYLTHEADVPLIHEQDTYQRDANGSIFHINETGAIEYNQLYPVGSPVLDSDDQPIIRHRRGDVILDVNGLPTVDGELSYKKEFDMLFVDGKHYFVDDLAFVQYNNELTKIINKWITRDLASIQKVLLEKTKIYLYPKTTLGKVRVHTSDEGQDYISSEQSLTVNLYVSEEIFKNIDIRNSLKIGTVSILDEYISGLTVNMSEVQNALRIFYGDSVRVFTVTGLEGAKNYQFVQLTNEESRLCLKKVIDVQQDNTTIIREDVTIEFHIVK